MKKVIIDASRGGEDIGNQKNDLIEKDFNLKIATYINNRLQELGIESFVTRTDDKTISNDERVNLIKNKFGNSNNVILIANSINNGNTGGAEIIYSLRNSDGLSTRIANKLENSGQKVNKYYQKRLPSSPEQDYYYLLRDTKNIEAILINYGYIDNPDDYNTLLNDYEKLGEAVVEAIANYVGAQYTPFVSDDIYIVKKGDTLYAIARKYNLTVDELKELNNLTTNNLNIGQRLKVKKEETSPNYYTVQSGDKIFMGNNEYMRIKIDFFKCNNFKNKVQFLHFKHCEIIK